MAFAHPALAVPLLTRRVGDVVRRHADGAALVAGTVGADALDYFARMSARPWIHRDAWAVLAAGVGGGLVLVLLLAIGGAGIARALPPSLAARFGAALTRSLGARGAARIALGLVVGAVLHVACDAVTTKHGFLAAHVPWRAVANVSTVVAVLVIVAGIALAPRVEGAPAFSWRALVAVLMGGTVAAGALAAVRLALDGTIADAMAAGSGGALLGVAVTGMLVRALERTSCCIEAAAARRAQGARREHTQRI